MDEQEKENQNKIDFVYEFAEGLQNLVKMMSNKFGVDENEIMLQLFLGVLSDDGENLIRHINYMADSRDELEYMLDEVSGEYKEDTIDFWLDQNGFSLN